MGVADINLNTIDKTFYGKLLFFMPEVFAIIQTQFMKVMHAVPLVVLIFTEFATLNCILLLAEGLLKVN